MAERTQYYYGRSRPIDAVARSTTSVGISGITGLARARLIAGIPLPDGLF